MKRWIEFLVLGTGMLFLASAYTNCAKDLELPQNNVTKQSSVEPDGQSNDQSNQTTTQQPAAPELSSDKYELKTGDTAQLSIHAGFAPFTFVVTPSSGGSVDVNTLVFTANQAGATGVSVTDRFGNSSAISINIRNPLNCTLPWGGTLAHGASVRAYLAQTVYNGSCASQVRTCNDGALSGSASYMYNKCTVQSTSTYSPYNGGSDGTGNYNTVTNQPNGSPGSGGYDPTPN